MIVNVAFSSTPVFVFHRLCATLGVSYVEFQQNSTIRHSNPVHSFVPNKLVYFYSLKDFAKCLDGLVASTNRWLVIVLGSDLEAAEYNLPYVENFTDQTLLNFLTENGEVLTLLRRKEKQSLVVNYLSKVITELYKIPKDERPVKMTFEILAGLRQRVPQAYPPGLIKAIQLAHPLTEAIKQLPPNHTKEDVRAIAKVLNIDIFEINYCLAKTRAG